MGVRGVDRWERRTLGGHLLRHELLRDEQRVARAERELVGQEIVRLASEHRAQQPLVGIPNLGAGGGRGGGAGAVRERYALVKVVAGGCRYCGFRPGVRATLHPMEAQSERAWTANSVCVATGGA